MFYLLHYSASLSGRNLVDGLPRALHTEAIGGVGPSTYLWIGWAKIENWRKMLWKVGTNFRSSFRLCIEVWVTVNIVENCQWKWSFYQVPNFHRGVENWRFFWKFQIFTGMIQNASSIIFMRFSMKNKDKTLFFWIVLRVFRAETRLTVYRALYIILKLLGYPMGGWGQRLSVLWTLKN